MPAEGEAIEVSGVHDVVVETVAIALAAATVSGVARRAGVPAPIALVLAGVAASLVGVLTGATEPQVGLDPDLVLLVFLPPLLYSAALESSYVNIRRNIRPILQLSVGLVIFTALVVACTAHYLAGLPWSAAFVLGAVVAPPDAVAATAVGRTVGMPRRVLTILGGESLLNDATALTLFRLGLLAAAGGLSVAEGIRTTLLSALGGALIGLVLAPVVHQLRIRMTEPILENAFALLLPFAAYVLAEAVNSSGVLAVVVLGLYLGHHEAETSFAVRLQARAVWRMLDFLLESVVFLLIGLQVPPIVRAALRLWGPWELALYGAVVIVVVIAARYVWIYPTTYLPRWISRRLREDNPVAWQEPAVLGWSGMRGVVSLAAALAIPQTLPAESRVLVLYLTVCVVLGTLVIHGFTLPWVIRRLGVGAGEESGDVLAEAQVQHAAARAAVDRLDTLLAEEGEIPDGVEDRLRANAEHRANSAWERLGGGGAGMPRVRADPLEGGSASGVEAAAEAAHRADAVPQETPAQVFRRLRREMLDAERSVFVDMRDAGRIDDEVLRRVINELDLEEAMLTRD
ncbi:MAG TPA: Na+/H+ antiporter [Mycobacteriales bacterium]|nr:Na+/H+ antiporter [Cryptosporangiaceae bacterium]HEV7756114.1 Na+/H+ antiporter [Mycobacteriales bacterium]